MRSRVIAAALLSIGLPASAAFAANGEEWQYEMSMEMMGMKMPLPGSQACVRPDEGNTPPVEKNCKIKDRKVSGNTTTFHIVCGAPDSSELQGQFTRKGDRIEGRYTMKQAGESMTVVAHGRKLGPCDPASSR